MSIFVCLFIGERFNKQAAYMFVSDSNTILALVISICSFMCFKNLKIGYSKLINTIGAVHSEFYLYMQIQTL